MKKWFVISVLTTATLLLVSFTHNEDELTADNLRKLYSQSPDKWPRPSINAGVVWTELGQLPNSPLEPYKDSLKAIIELGKILFFDPRLSSTGKISCATCHQPELSWTDGKERSVGHEGAVNKRNAPTIQNSWFYKKLFWDGRAKDLADQAFAPINSESEMHNDMRELPFNLRKIKGYTPLFKAAFADGQISPDNIAAAIAGFEKTIISRRSRFDEFLAGKKKALNNDELKGLHLFRTKAKCMNCHNGPLFTDNLFHNNGFSAGDPGLYNVTHKEEDIGKLKTPSLRDVMQTGPWMHNGAIHYMMDILPSYNKGPVINGEPLLGEPLYLTNKEMAQIVLFLKAISSPPLDFQKPALPQ